MESCSKKYGPWTDNGMLSEWCGIYKKELHLTPIANNPNVTRTRYHLHP